MTTDGHSSKLKQKLAQNLSTWQIQVMNMVMLPHTELAERVKQELIENPALEEGHDSDPDEPLDSQSDEMQSEEEISMDDYADVDDIPETTLRRYYEGQKGADEIPFAEEQSLQESLNEQLPLTELSERDQQIASFLVGSLDDDGYLRRSLLGISDDLAIYQGVEISEAHLTYILSVVQSLEPAGIAARSLQECLMLQLERRKPTEVVQLARKLVRDHFDELTHKQIDRLSERC